MTEIEPVSPGEFYGDQRQSYDRLDGESQYEHALFAGYLDLGPQRSLSKLAEHIGMPRNQLHTLSSKHSWVARARSFDEEQVRRALAELEGEGVEMRKRHAEAAKATMEKAMQAVESVDARFIQARDIPAWLDIASKLERLSRGVSDAPKRVEITGAKGGPIEMAAGLSAEDRRALLAAVQDQINQRIGVPEVEGYIEGELVEDDEDSTG